MRSTLNQTLTPASNPMKFPILLKHIGPGSKFLILATAMRSGVVVNGGNSSYVVGDWLGTHMVEADRRDVWEPYAGTVILAND